MAPRPTTYQALAGLVLLYIGGHHVSADVNYTALPADMDWEAAAWACSNLTSLVGKDATLVMVNPSNVREVEKVATSEYSWIDLHYANGKWVHANGTAPSATYWGSTPYVQYPDLSLGKCAGFNRATGTWWNSECSRHMGAICQRSGSSPGSCPASWQAAGGGCYRTVATPASAAKASDGCGALHAGAHLVSVHSDAQLAAVAAQAAAAGASLWTGLSFASGRLQWTDGSETEYIKTAPHVKPHVVPGLDCALVTADGTWGWVACGKKIGYLCML